MPLYVPQEGPLVVVHQYVGPFADIVPAVSGVAIDISFLCANENAFRERLSAYGVVLSLAKPHRQTIA